MSVSATILVLALSRAELIDRVRAPVLTREDGLVRVFANCSADLRREYQQPIAAFAEDTVETLYRGLSVKPRHFDRPGIEIHIGDIRTNDTRIVTQVVTNEGAVVSRLYVKSPSHADLSHFRVELVKAFHRSLLGSSLGDAAAIAAYRRADPRLRIADERARLEDWLAGHSRDTLSGEAVDDEEGLHLLRKVVDPGHASCRDVLTFASRLFLYPPTYDAPFCGKYDCLSFRRAVKNGKIDARIRLAALQKVNSLMAFGSGRGEKMTAAAKAYGLFLLAFAAGEQSEREVLDLLEQADVKLNLAMEEARQREEGTKK